MEDPTSADSWELRVTTHHNTVRQGLSSLPKDTAPLFKATKRRVSTDGTGRLNRGCISLHPTNLATITMQTQTAPAVGPGLEVGSGGVEMPSSATHGRGYGM